jgi:glutathione S-transferase
MPICDASASCDHMVELREVSLRDKPATMLDASAKRTVPVMVLPEGSVIDQSLDIMRWAFAASADTITPGDPTIIALNDGRFKHHLDRYKYADRYSLDGIDHRSAATEILERLNTKLNDGDHLGGDRAPFTDLAVMPFVRQFAATDWSYFNGLPFASLQGWLARHMTSDLFMRAMVRRSAWSPNDDPFLFP